MPCVLCSLVHFVVPSSMSDLLDNFELLFVGKFVSQILLWLFIPALVQIFLFNNVVKPNITKYLQLGVALWGLYLICPFIYYVTNRLLSDPHYSLWNDINYDLVPCLLFLDYVFVIIVAMVQIYLQSDDFGIKNRWIYIIGTFFLIGYPLWLYRVLEAEEKNATSAPDTTERKGKLTPKSILPWIYLGLIAFFIWYPASLDFYNTWKNYDVVRWGFTISKSPAVAFLNTTITWAWLVVNIWVLPKWGVKDQSLLNLSLNFLLLWFFAALTLTHVSTSICVFLAFQQGLVNASITGPITVQNLLDAMKAGLPTAMEIDPQKKTN